MQLSFETIGRLNLLAVAIDRPLQLDAYQLTVGILRRGSEADDQQYQVTITVLPWRYILAGYVQRAVDSLARRN